MILAKICLCAFVFGIIYIHRNYAATTVLYHFEIRETHTERNETAVIKDSEDVGNGNDVAPELIVTGIRKALLTLGTNNLTASTYRETTIYTADNDGYKARYNFSLRRPVELGPRLNPDTLKTTVG